MLRCEFLEAPDGTPRFKFLKGEHPLHFGYQCEFATWLQFTKAYDYQAKRQPGGLLDLDELAKLYSDAKAAYTQDAP